LNVNQLNDAAKMALVDITVAAGTLELDARKTLNGMKISAGQASQLVRDSFSGIRGTGKGWELLLSLGGLYLTSDSLGKNLKKAEEEIGSKSPEALVAFYGSSIGIAGNSIELIGLLMPHKTSSPNSITVGRTIARFGATISAAAGIFESIYLMMAAKRKYDDGDGKAALGYGFAAALAIGGVASAIRAVFSPLLIGALGTTIIISTITYMIIKWAEKKESTRLEQWANRCYFGIANELPRIHWSSPTHADIALAELNAATLELDGGLVFKAERADNAISSKIGGLVNLEIKRSLKFQFTLPHYSEATSGYHWILVIHRYGDGMAPDYVGGEVIVDDRFSPPFQKTRTARFSSMTTSKVSTTPDYLADSLSIKKSRRKIIQNGDEYHSVHFNGTIELTSDIGNHNITAATLLIAYWPDRNIANAYAEIAVQGEA
ncbi:hypothetical protein HU738_025495, partial [Pseudomonas sp. RW4S2]|nr:hypothetical protein [Pseudomonas vlassakiae]